MRRKKMKYQHDNDQIFYIKLTLKNILLSVFSVQDTHLENCIFQVE